MHSQFQAQRSLCGALRDKQLFGSKIHARPFLADFQSEELGGGCILNNPGLIGSPAFACEYSKVYNGGKFLAVADEEGFISILDTAGPLPRTTADDDEPKPRAQWLAHKNAVFDIAWAKSDAWMLAASGDQTISLWDTGMAEQLGTFRAHTGSVKSVCPQPGCSDVFASGARDGVLMVWDARVPPASEGAGGEAVHKPVVTVQDAHAPDEKKRKGRGRTPVQGRTKPSVTSVLFADSCTLATGGVDGILKLWDLRQAASPVARHSARAHLDRLASVPLPSLGIKQHGITSLALHPNGVELLVSLTGGHHMMYQLHRPQIGPTKLFGGHTVASFYVKAAFSPDGSHILSGSTDRKVYIWQVDGADGRPPYTLPGHEGEVTAVAWCASDPEQISTTADDATLRVWTVRRRDHSVREVPDVPEPLMAWRDPRLGLGSSGLTSPRPTSRRSSLSIILSAGAGPLVQPTTPQVPSACRTPSAPGAAEAAAAENDTWRGNSHAQQQQQPGGGVPGQTPAGVVLASPSAAQQAQQQQQGGSASVWRPASSAGRRPRSVAELHAALSSQQKQRRTKQQSIASFLSPPMPPLATRAPAGGGVQEAGVVAAGAATAGGQETAGDVLGSPRRGSDRGSQNRSRRMPMSPRLQRLEAQMSPRLKRLRVSFDVQPGFGGIGSQGTAAGSSEQQGGATAGDARQQGAEAAGSSTLEAAAAAMAAAAVAASQLEPSPLNAAGAPFGCAGQVAADKLTAAIGGAGGGGAVAAPGQLAACSPRAALQRQGSVDENAAGNPTAVS